MTERGQDDSSALGKLRLESLVLWECAVTRGNATSNEPGAANAKVNVDRRHGAGRAQYVVKQDVAVHNAAGDLLADISSTFVAEYSIEDGAELTDDQSEAFVKSVLLQVTPFQREFLATISNRLALQPMLMPLVRASDIERLKSQAEAQAGDRVDEQA